MKFKYYLRGAGIAICITTIIFAIALIKYKPSLSDEEIIKQAEVLGMVMATDDEGNDTENNQDEELDEPNDNQKNNSNDEEINENDQLETNDENSSEIDETIENDSPEENDEQADAQIDEQTDEQTDGDNQDNGNSGNIEETIKFVIKGGEFSDVVSNHLFEKGLVDDAEVYNKWLIEHHYDAYLLPGTFYIPKGATKKEIATILTTKQE